MTLQVKNKIEIAKNSPLQGEWVHEILLGPANDYTRVGYDDPWDLSDIAHVRSHVWQELEDLHRMIALDDASYVLPVSSEYISKLKLEIIESTTAYITGNADPTGATQAQSVDHWYDEELNADTLIDRDIAEMMRQYWLTMS